MSTLQERIAAAEKMTAAEIAKLEKVTQGLASGLSGWEGTYLTPGTEWAANIQTGEITYDVALTAILDDRQRVGVAAHEVGHLRFTTTYKTPDRLKHARELHTLVNAIEDARMERLMVAEFPGLTEPIASLRRALMTPEAMVAMAAAPPGAQLISGAWRIAFGYEPRSGDETVARELAEHAEEIRAMVDASSTRNMAKILFREGGLADKLAAHGGRPAQLSTAAIEAVLAAAEQGEAQEGVTASDVAASTSTVREILAAATAHAPELADEVQDALADALDDAVQILQGATQEADEAHGRAAGHVAGVGTAERTDDDRSFGEPDDGQYHYDRIANEVEQSADVLRRSLDQVLRQNRFDRLSSVPYRTGPRLHTAALVRSRTQRRPDAPVFRRKTRSRNRQYAIAVLADCSTSMNHGSPKPITQAQRGVVLVDRALDRLDGVEHAIYAFAHLTRCVKPFSHTSRDCEHVTAGAVAIQRYTLGGGTNLAAALQRASGDMDAGYDESWRKVIVILTDGRINTTVSPVARRLEQNGYELHALGIGGLGLMRTVFTRHREISDPAEIPEALTDMVRRTVARDAREVVS